MAEILDEDEYQRLQRLILELFAPVTGPTRRDAKSVRFGLGEVDIPGMLFSHWAAIRGLVWAFQEVAPTAWSEIKTLVQDAQNGMYAQRVGREEPDRGVIPEEPARWDQLFLAHAAVRLKEAGLPPEVLGLRAEDEEIRASAPERQPLVVPNLPALQEWRAKWNLADDRSLFTWAVVAAAINETNLFGSLSATNIAWVTFASLLTTWLPTTSEIPGSAPWLAESLQAALRPPSPQAFRFEFAMFNPFFETAAPFKVAARKAFNRELDAHIKACRTALSTQDQEFTPVPVKRVPDIHFRWYIRFQVLGQSLGEITKKDPDKASRGDVSKAIRDVTQLAGVPLREPKRPGRRKKDPSSDPELSN
jgi:hypothetical protein